MGEEKGLVPVEQKQVLFYEDEITAVLVQTEGPPQVFVPLRPICEQLGVTWPSQLNRINRDPVLSKKVRGVFVTNTPGGRQEMSCLPLDYLNGWLFGINANRVNPDIRDRLIRYQEECYRVLAEAFRLIGNHYPLKMRSMTQLGAAIRSDIKNNRLHEDLKLREHRVLQPVGRNSSRNNR